MFWTLKKKFLGICGKITFLGLYILITIFFKGNFYEPYLKNYLNIKILKETNIKNQLLELIGLLLYPVIVEIISTSKLMICPKINCEIILNRHQKIIECFFSSREIANNSKILSIFIEKNFETIFGKIVLFLSKYYQFILEIKYPNEIGLDLVFLESSTGVICRKCKKEEWKGLINDKYKFIHVKEENKYYINILDIGENSDYENEYTFNIVPKGVLKHSKIKSNLTFYTKEYNKITFWIFKIFYLFVWLFLILVINFKPINIGIIVEKGDRSE